MANQPGESDTNGTDSASAPISELGKDILSFGDGDTEWLKWALSGRKNSMANQPTVSDIFRRAMEIRTASPGTSNKDLKDRIISEFGGGAFPSNAYLTIPEYDNIVPEEDWTAGLPIVLRGIQNESWEDVAQGILISLEQVENYPIQSGREDDPAKEWRNREKGIAGADEKVREKWMPEELMAMAKKNTKS